MRFQSRLLAVSPISITRSLGRTLSPTPFPRRLWSSSSSIGSNGGTSIPPGRKPYRPPVTSFERFLRTSVSRQESALGKDSLRKGSVEAKRNGVPPSKEVRVPGDFIVWYTLSLFILAMLGIYVFGPISWRSLAVMGVVAAGGLYYLQHEKQQMEARMKRVEAERQTATYGKAQIGGPFTLTDCETGKTVTEKNFHGKFMVIYFGFTHCPDVCPDELEKMSRAITQVDRMKGVGDMVTPVFISIDPGRDTPDVVHRYIKEFHPRFRGLTGTEEQVQAAAKAYRIYISKGDPMSGDENDYLVDHSIFFFLMDPEGNFADFFGRNAKAEEVADQIMKRVRQWNLDKKAGRI